MACVKTVDLITLARPRQWTKSLAVFAALVFAGKLFHPDQFGIVVVAFVALCLVSSGLYAANDVWDCERDRRHPLKRERPVAAGCVSKRAALLFAVVLITTGLVLSAALGLPFLASILGYVVLQSAYAASLKHVAIVDMLVIAAGFVIRAVAGALVISVEVSPWLVVCTGLLALFLAAAKRRHELVLLQDDSAGHRPVLSEYSAGLLDSFMVTLSAGTITSYALYTFFEARTPWHAMMLTIPFVIYGILRYQMLVLNRELGGRPTEVLLSDQPLLACVTLWMASAVVALYAMPAILP